MLARLIPQPIDEIDDIVTRARRAQIKREKEREPARGEGSLGKLRGSHALESWGARLGIAKTGTGIEAWGRWTAEMQARCATDVEITAALYHFLKPEAYSLAAIELEHGVAAVCEAITTAGAPFDRDAALRLAAHLDTLSESLRWPLVAMFEKNRAVLEKALPHFAGVTIALGLVPAGTERTKSELHKIARENSKTFRYAFLFGAGQERAGTIIRDACAAIGKVDAATGAALHRQFFGDTARPGEVALRRVGKAAIEAFLAATPGLRELRGKLVAFQDKHQWLPGLDGRRVACAANYTALNYCCTSAEAIVCKAWLVAVHAELCERFHYGPEGDCEIILWTHDEITVCCTPEIAGAIGEILTRHAVAPREAYRFKCSLAADYTVAPSWNGEIVEAPAPAARAHDSKPDIAPKPRTWREDISAINVAMAEQGIDAPLLSEAVAAFMDPPPAADVDEPELDLAPPPKVNGHAGNGATPPSDARAGGSFSPDPLPDRARRKLYKRIVADLHGRDYRCVASFDNLLPGGDVAFAEDRFELHPARAAAHPDCARKLYRFRHRGTDGVVYADTGPRRIIYGWPAILAAGPGAQVSWSRARTRRSR